MWALLRHEIKVIKTRMLPTILKLTCVDIFTLVCGSMFSNNQGEIKIK